MSSYSDDEMLCNNITIRTKVVNKRRRCSSINITFEEIDADQSLKIIETSSEPNLVSRAALNNSISSFESDSLDKMVADLELRYNINTQDVNNRQDDKIDIQFENYKPRKIMFEHEKIEKDDTDSVKHISPNLSNQCSILKTSNKLINNHIKVHKCPAKYNLFEHIRSPVAMYIKQSPQVPLLQNVKPEKSLEGTNLTTDFGNCLKTKYNLNYKPLPTVAYKSAKNTKVLEIPDEKKLPRCQWADKLTSSLPRAVVIRHVQRRNITLTKKEESLADNSFADLTLHQAKLSICTLESAYKKNNV
ncbi:PREDICTED: uncharacterized protein LOC106126116 [Papilio xuthus]|uniref:Uncharacterized protein LOC106126116 n=1 Tax=Papilio xuthus TaxID=66420 RepID=A0AAJ6ZTN7_PAPXU|nr:PREDICTED: uncharacterized protein LOC106126116 [Papilio xuthus]